MLLWETKKIRIKVATIFTYVPDFDHEQKCAVASSLKLLSNVHF